MPIAIARRADASNGTLARADAVGRLAERALRCELELTPKPGLVDRANSGAHRDMDFATFDASIGAIAPWLRRFVQRGVAGCDTGAAAFLPWLRRDGRGCESDMFTATGGVNTHKGAVFSFALLCAATGRLLGRGTRVDEAAVCAEVATLAAGLVAAELGSGREPRSAGERIYRAHGLTGVRGEAEGGFATARVHGVLPYRRARARGAGEAQALHESLLHLIANNADTNLVSRGGLEGLRFVRDEARRVLARTGCGTADRVAALAAFDALLIGRNLSPGGSADLLAVSWFLAELGELSPPMYSHCPSDEATFPRQDRGGAAGGSVPLRLRAGAGEVQQRRAALAVDLGEGTADLEADQPAELE